MPCFCAQGTENGRTAAGNGRVSVWGRKQNIAHVVQGKVELE